VLGGLLSGFQFSRDPRLLDLADDLANRMLPAFDTRTGIPYRFVNLATGAVSGTDSNPAEAGTLIMEFGLLSDLTGKPVYRDLAKRSLEALFERRSGINLVGAGIDSLSGVWLDKSSHIAGLIDSYYEYLLKGWKLFGDEDLKAMWNVHLPALLEHVVTDHDGRTWCRRVDMESGREIAPHYGALDAFFVGTLALAGEIETAAALQKSGMAMWTKYGLEAERIDFKKMDVAGVGEDDGAYYLRPELAESAYYLFWATGEDQYRDMGAVILEGLVCHCRTDEAYAAVSDIRTMEKLDSMESFFLTETLKYLYLLFADDGTRYLDEYVFTTEAHPLRREMGDGKRETDRANGGTK
jgi:mannosidase alpha-like ER degradation enhancer 2